MEHTNGIQTPLLQSLNQVRDSVESFNHIELEEDEIEEALRKGREEKHYRLKRIEYSQKISTKKVYPKYTWTEVRGFYANEFDIDSENEKEVDLLCQYFTNDPEFEQEGRKLSKGICIFGGVGIGKSTLMNLFSKNQQQSYVMKMCRAVEDEYAQEGDKILKGYGLPRHPAMNSDPFGHQVLGMCFDDLGTEPVSKYYGKECEVMAEIILNRYDNQIAFNLTHITTNLSPDKIRERYGTRVTDRMREMFNMIKFNPSAKSRRK